MPTPEQDAIWAMMFERLGDFWRKNGHCRVPLRGADRRLGNWVSNQRQAAVREELLPERHKRLMSLGFEFDVDEARWERLFAALAAFKLRHGHSQVPRHYKETPELGVWVTYQRYLDHCGRLPAKHSRLLEKLGFDFAPPDPRWNAHYARLVEFQRKYGHCNVPAGDAFGQWVYKQRRFWRDGKLSAWQIERLEAIGFHWVKPGRLAVVNHARWLRNMRALKAFKEAHGHCRVPQKLRNRRGLGIWVANVRALYRRRELPADRVRALEGLGFEWRIKR